MDKKIKLFIKKIETIYIYILHVKRKKKEIVKKRHG